MDGRLVFFFPLTTYSSVSTTEMQMLISLACWFRCPYSTDVSCIKSMLRFLTTVHSKSPLHSISVSALVVNFRSTPEVKEQEKKREKEEKRRAEQEKKDQKEREKKEQEARKKFKVRPCRSSQYYSKCI